MILDLPDIVKEQLAAGGYAVLLKIASLRETRTDSGIAIAYGTEDYRERVKESSVIGEIVEFGPLAFLKDGGPEACGFHVGQKVIFARSRGTRISLPDEPDEESRDYISIEDDFLMLPIRSKDELKKKINTGR